MKKALTITIAGTLFTIEEDAYQVLDNYLQSIQQYFGSYPDSKEIINDIEARIAEQLLERNNKDAVVTIDDVHKLISVMGRVEDFDDDHNKNASQKSSETKGSYQRPRRLYRNPDDVWVMGVASGIGAYFDIDPLFIRIGFIILTFITGLIPGVVIYFILSLIIPTAQTAAEKMQMRGGPVNLQSFKESMNEYSAHLKTDSKNFGENVKKRSKEMAENIKKSAAEMKEQWKHNDDSARQPDQEVVYPKHEGGLIGLIRSMVRLVFKLIGFAIKLAATLGIIFVTFVFIAFIFHFHGPAMYFPLAQVVSWPIYYVLITLGYLAVILPLSLMSLIGNVVMLKGKPHELDGAIGIIGTWFAVVLIIGFLWFSYGSQLETKMKALPDYQLTNPVSLV